jgi:hypothetical protein
MRGFERPLSVLRVAGARAPAALAVLLGATVGSPCLAAALHGTVVDPQDRVVAGAAVRLTCGEASEERVTGPLGAFRFDRPAAFTDCRITASATGFGPAPAEAVGGSRSLRLRLRLPTLNESLTVRPPASDAGLSAFRSLASVSIPRSELRKVSDDTRDLVEYARARAGLTRSTVDHVYVDGLPASTLPPAETVERIAIDGDPFSVEYADGSEGHVDIVTVTPDRQLRWSLGGNGLGLGGRSVLDDSASSASRAWRMGLSGAVPHLPFTFSLHSTLARGRQEVPVRALTPAGLEAPPTAAVSSSSGSIGLALHYSRGAGTRASVSFFGTRGRQSNIGLSGIALPEAGMSLRSDMQELRTTFTTSSPGVRHSAGLVGSWSTMDMKAESQLPGVGVSGAWTGGGADTARAEIGTSRWMLKYVAEARPDRRFWRAGGTFAWHSDVETRVANPAGHLVFESSPVYAAARAGLGTGTWFGARGGGRTAYAGTAWSSFAEGDLMRTAGLRLRAGLRADHQSGAGTLLAPRLSGAATWRGATLRWGGGVFVHNWSGAVLLQAFENDRSHLDRFLVRDVALVETRSADTNRAIPIDSRLADDLSRPRDLVLRASIERPLGGVTPGVEYTWTRATHRLGSRRLPDGVGWVDTLESNRRGRKHQLHMRVETAVGGQGVSAHYRWTRSRDDTDGPFSFPASQHDLAAEEARSAGVAPHEVSIVGRFKLPGDVSLTVVEAWHSSTPYNVTTGTDPGGLGLYSFRGARRRNSGDGPGYHSLSFYASRRMALPLPAKGNGQRIYAHVSLRLENLLDDKNYLILGSVAGSPLLGTPLAAQPGRSLRVSVSFDR